MRPNGRNEAPMLVGVAESSKLLSFNLDEDTEERQEQVRANLVAIQSPRGRPVNKGCLLILPPQNSFNEGMQPNLGVDVEG